MYSVDGRDRVELYQGLPPWSTGASLPTVVSADGSPTLVAYIVHEPDPGFDGTNPRTVSPGSPDELIAIIRFHHVQSIMFGTPNDEVLHGHPLYGRGLQFYGAHEVMESSWIRALMKINSVHGQFSPGRWASARHFILAFQDSTLECVATSVEVVEIVRGSMVEAQHRMVDKLGC
jgi:hypothetical protein